MSLAQVRRQGPQLGSTFKQSSVAQRAIATMSLIGHEVDSNSALRIRRVVAETTERRRGGLSQMIMQLQSCLEKILMVGFA
jgi:hypothetical protein